MRAAGKRFFEEAYRLGDRRTEAGFGWPMKGAGREEKEFLAEIRKSLKSGRILDLGCGEGRISIFFAKNGFESFGIDFVESAIARAKKFAKEENAEGMTHFRTGNVLSLPYPDGFFDAAVDWSVFDHIEPENREKYIENLMRVLKPKAFFMLTVFSAKTGFMRGKRKSYYSGDAYFRFFTEEEIRGIFGKHFEAIKVGESVSRIPPPIEFLHFLMKRK